LVWTNSLGCKPKGQNQLPFNSQYPFLRLPYDSFERHSCRRLNDLATARHAHNPKVGGSNPPPATIESVGYEFFFNLS
jgi:hypothetical protein